MIKEKKERDKLNSCRQDLRPETPIYIRLIAWLRFALPFVLILALGFLAINQALGFFYKIHFLTGPCDLCGELNPGVQECIDDLNSARPSYFIGDGEWSDPFRTPNNTINITINP